MVRPTNPIFLSRNPKRDFFLAVLYNYSIIIKLKSTNPVSVHCILYITLYSGPILTGGVQRNGKWMWEKITNETDGRQTTYDQIVDTHWFPGNIFLKCVKL